MVAHLEQQQITLLACTTLAEPVYSACLSDWVSECIQWDLE